MTTVTMSNCETVLYSGPITAECLQFIHSYKERHLDLSKAATDIKYTYDPTKPTTDLEKRMIRKIQDCEYDAFDEGLHSLIWTMK